MGSCASVALIEEKKNVVPIFYQLVGLVICSLHPTTTSATN